MKQNHPIPFYGPDGTPLGYRSPEAAERLVANGYAKPVYGRKRHLKAIFLPSEDGSSPVQRQPRSGARYSSLQSLDYGGHCWELRRVNGRNDDGTRVSTRGVFLQVIADCGGA